jgi:hypothetical protein
MVAEHWKTGIDALCVKNRYSPRVRPINGRTRSFDHLFRKYKATIIDATSASVSKQLVHVVQNTLGYCRKNVLVQSPSSPMEIPVTVLLEHRDRYEAQGRGFFPQSMRLASDETVGEDTDICGAGRPFHIPSNSRRTTKSSSVLVVVDSIYGLSFDRGEGSYNSTNHFVESLTIFL